MSRVTASVPGKAILVGEHAAVYGHPALVAGVGLRLTATLEGRGRGGRAVEFALPDLGAREEHSWASLLEEAESARRGWEAWRDHRGELPMVAADDRAGRVVRLALAEAEAALRELGPGIEQTLGGCVLTVSSELPLGAGLGSSAAVAVSVIAAAARIAGQEVDPSWIEAVAGQVERRQHGSPSGVDVAAVLRGGVLRFSHVGDTTVFESLSVGESEATALESLQLFHSGSPAESTGEVVAAVRSLRARQPELVADCFREIEEAGQDFHRTLLERRVSPEAVRRAHRALVGLGVVPEPVMRQIEEIERLGGAAKISGAGSLRGPGAGLVLAWCEEGAAEPPWRRLQAPLGAAGLEVVLG